MSQWTIGPIGPSASIGSGIALHVRDRGHELTVTAGTLLTDPSIFLRGRLASEIAKEVVAANYKDALTEAGHLDGAVRRRLDGLKEQRTKLIRELEPILASIGEIEAMLRCTLPNGLGDARAALGQEAQKELQRVRSRIAEEAKIAAETRARQEEEADRWRSQELDRAWKKQKIEDQIRRLQAKAENLDRPPVLAM